jgi:O-antigen/teichoic acid export membrane protein
VKPFWILGIDRNVQIAVGTQQYGIYFPLFNFSMLLLIILDPGLHTFINSNLAKDNDQASKYLSAFIPLKLILAGLYVLFTIVLAVTVGYRGTDVSLLLILAFNQVLASIVLFFRAQLAGMYRFNTDSIISVLDRILMILFCGLLLWTNLGGNHIDIHQFIYAQTIAYCFTLVIAFIAVIGKVKLNKPRLQFSFLKTVMRRSYPFALLTILMTVYTRIDAVMIERLLPGKTGETEAGIYASAYRLLDASNMVAFLFATVLLPVFSGMLDNKPSIREVASNAFRLLMIPAFLLTVVCFFYRVEIMHLLYRNQSTPYSAEVFGFLMLSFPALCIVYIFGTLLTANGSLAFLNQISAAGVIANVILNLILIRYYHALGAVIATLATQALVSLVQLFKAKKIFEISLGKKEIWRTLFFLLLTITTIFLMKHFEIQWVMAIILICGISLTFAFLSGLFKLHFFLNIINIKRT